METVGQGNYSVWGQVVLVAKHLYGGVAQLGERLLCKQNVASSILVTSTILHAVSSFGRALALQARGGWFNPNTAYQFYSGQANTV